jgi:hypothetical protein
MSFIKDMRAYDDSVLCQRPKPSCETQLANGLRLEIMKAVHDAAEAGLSTNAIVNVVVSYGNYLTRVRDYARKHKLADVATMLENEADALAA